jgi:alpha-glucuronidase
MQIIKALGLFFITVFITGYLKAEDGHQLWLRSKPAKPVTIVCAKKSATLEIAKTELQQGWQGKAGAAITLALVKDKNISASGYRISENAVQATTDIGILYGVYDLLRRQQTGQAVNNEISNPSYGERILNHWDNPDGSIERGYAGNSIFWRKDNAFTVTAADKALWQEYARANASVGINGAVLNNVNASPLILTADYLARTKAIAAVLRPYGVKVYLSVKFSSRLWRLPC